MVMERQPPDNMPRDRRFRPPNAAPLRANQWLAEQLLADSLRGVRLYQRVDWMIRGANDALGLCAPGAESQKSLATDA
jgi:hypothetical protein